MIQVDALFGAYPVFHHLTQDKLIAEYHGPNRVNQSQDNLHESKVKDWG